MPPDSSLQRSFGSSPCARAVHVFVGVNFGTGQYMAWWEGCAYKRKESVKRNGTPLVLYAYMRQPSRIFKSTRNIISHFTYDSLTLDMKIWVFLIWVWKYRREIHITEKALLRSISAMTSLITDDDGTVNLNVRNMLIFYRNESLGLIKGNNLVDSISFGTRKRLIEYGVLRRFGSKYELTARALWTLL